VAGRANEDGGNALSVRDWANGTLDRLRNAERPEAGVGQGGPRRPAAPARSPEAADELKREVAARSWYHSIDLGHGIVTPGRSYGALWDAIRACRAGIDYRGKTILDLASWDGLWAFEAEASGAGLVIATDCANTWHGPAHSGMDNLIFVREVLRSSVLPLWNVPPYDLTTHLAPVVHSHPQTRKGLDVVQHLGLLYHLRDPLRSLAQARAVLKVGGSLLLETAVYNSDTCAMYFNKDWKDIYEDTSTWWAPTPSCLLEMLRTSLFDVDEKSIRTVDTGHERVGRMVVTARARAPRDPVDVYIVDPAFGQGFGDLLVREP
jgi:tRNA (mo5U34)-methyltransferase